MNTINNNKKSEKDGERNVTILTNEQTIEIKEKFVKNVNSENREIEEIKIVNKESCWLDVTKDKSLMTNDRKKHKKVFFFIVDALRLDFMVKKDDSIIAENDTITAKKDGIEFKKGEDEALLKRKSRNLNLNNYDSADEKESIIRDAKEDKTINEVKKNGSTTALSSFTSSSPPPPPPSSTSSPSSSPSSPYNKFKNLHQLLRNNATQTAFFGFRADPPTVTSQRLKGVI